MTSPQMNYARLLWESLKIWDSTQMLLLGVVRMVSHSVLTSSECKQHCVARAGLSIAGCPESKSNWGCFVALFLQAHDKLQLMRSRICGWNPFQTCLSNDMGRSWISELVESSLKVDVCKNVQRIRKRMEEIFPQLKPREQIGKIGKDRSWEPELRLRASFAFDCRLQTPWFECQIQMLSTLRSKFCGTCRLACKQNYHACTGLLFDVFFVGVCWNGNLAWGYQQGDYFKPHTDGSWNGSRITSKGSHSHCRCWQCHEEKVKRSHS